MRLKFILLAALLIFSISLLVVSLQGARSEYLRVDFLDVGQGDAILVTSPSGAQMLVDAGSNTSVLRALGSVMNFSDRTIDVVVPTHPDADHIGGFPGVLDRYDISFVVGINADKDTQIFEQFLEKVQQEGAHTFTAERGQVIDLGAGVFAQVLFPYKDTTITGNDASVILKVIYKDSEILLTGDAGKGVEEHLVQIDGPSLESDVLKVGHHGSKTSTSKLFVEVVKPIYSIISAGRDNRFKHPHSEVIEILSTAGVPFAGTYEEGTITVWSDGEQIWKE